MARAQVNTDLGRPEAIQPMAQTRGIQAPVADIGISPLTRLAESLSAVAPGLKNVIADIEGQYKEDEANRAYDTIQGMTFEEAQAAVQSGTMRDTESPWFRAAFQKQFGLAHAAERKREIVTAYNTEFDKDGGDLDAFLTQYVKDDLEAYGSSEFIKAGMREGMSGFFDNIRNTHAEYTSGQLQTRAVEQFYTIAGDAVESAVANGEDINGALANIYSQHQATLGITPDVMDAQALALAERFALEGNLEAADAVLSANPSGRGSFKERAGFADKAFTILENGKSVRGKNLREENTTTRVTLEEKASRGLLTDDDVTALTALRDTEQMSQDQLEGLLAANNNGRTKAVAAAWEANTKSTIMDSATALVTGGRGYTLTDTTVVNPHDGSEVNLKADDLVQDVVDEQLNAMAAKNATPQVMASQLAMWGVDATFSPWEKAMSDGYIAANKLRKVSKDGTMVIPEDSPALAGFAIWKAMAHEPALRARHVKTKEAADVYTNAEILERTGQWTADEALAAAVGISDVDLNGLSGQKDRNAFQSAVRSALSTGLFGSGETSLNAGLASRHIERHVDVLMAMGMPMKSAVNAAATAWKESNTISGGAIFNHRDKFIPQNFETISENVLSDFAEANDLDVSDIRLIPAHGADQNFWEIVDANTFAPLGAPLHIRKLQQDPHLFTREKANAEITKNGK